MGTCFSKKKTSSSPPPPLPPPAPPATGYGYGYGVVDSSIESKPKSETQAAELKTKVKKHPGGKPEQIAQQGENQDQEPQVQVKKEVFVIKHRRSHDERGDRDCKKTPLPQNQIQPNSPPSDAAVVFAAATASSPQIGTAAKTGACSESADDVDKVGKRVRTLSCNKEELDAILIQCGRLSRSNSSGPANRTRKYSGSKRSYDFDASDGHANVSDICNDADGEDEGVVEEKTHRQSSRSRPSSPSSQGRRRRRTPSRERNQQQQHQRSSSRERRTSISPGKRSSSNANSAATASSTANANPRPGKMVSVPAAAINSGGESATNIKRISVKRNVGSPRAQSPARVNGRAPNDGQQQPSLSRSSSRKAEHSPYRRNPLAEIDPNSLAYPQVNNNNRKKREIQAEEEIVVKEPTHLQKPTLETNSNRIVTQGVNYITSNSPMDNKNKVLVEEAKGQAQGKPQTLTRSRSSRRSRDLDIDPETKTLSNPVQSLYTSLLLQDIQNFHQQNTPNAVSLPPCVSKACSIAEAVADLNSTTRSTPTDQMNKKVGPGHNASFAGKSIGIIADERKDPFVESEVVAIDDLMEPSFHKYVTVRRGTGAREDMEDQESSGSNSFVSGSSRSQQHNWGFSSSSQEPNSADSTDCWAPRSNTKEEDHKTPLRRLTGHERSGGIERGRLAAINARGLPRLPGVAAAASM